MMAHARLCAAPRRAVPPIAICKMWVNYLLRKTRVNVTFFVID